MSMNTDPIAMALFRKRGSIDDVQQVDMASGDEAIYVVSREDLLRHHRSQCGSAGYLQIDGDWRVLAASGPQGTDRTGLRQVQAHALDTSLGGEIARRLISDKIAGQSARSRPRRWRSRGRRGERRVP